MVQGTEYLERRGMGQHHSSGDIADGVDRRNGSLHVAVDRDTPSREGYAGLFEIESLQAGAASDRHQHHVGFDLGRFSFLEERNLAAIVGYSRHLS